MLQDVARERHGEVEVEAELGLGVRLGREALEDVDLLVDLAALGEPVDGLDDAGLDVGEAVQLEGARQRRDRPRARRRAAQAAARGTRSAGRSCSSSRPGDRGSSCGGLGGRGWWRARVRWRSARRGRAAPRCRRRAAAPCRPGCAASWRGRHRAGRCGRSSPAKSRSPENISSETSCSAYGVRNVTEPSVWPGVWSTTNRSPASSSSCEVGELAHVVGLGPRVVATEQHLGGLAGSSRPSGRTAGAGRSGGSTPSRRRCPPRGPRTTCGRRGRA